jgi:DNA-binding transcriptional LysR family regulator
LKIFESVYRLRNLSLVAHEFNLTQPAISHALSRLRGTLGDKLFIRTASGLEPTTRSDQLITPVRAALSMLADCLSISTDFEPQHCDREFRLLLSDVGELIFLPKLIGQLRIAAPRARVTALQAPRHQYDAMLEDREADLAIGSLPRLGQRLKQRRLFQDRYVVMRAANRTSSTHVLTLDEYQAAMHVVVEPPGSMEHPIENLLGKMGVSRTVTLRIPHFFSVPSVILASDLMVTVPRSVAVNLRNAEGIEVHELPFSSPDLDVKMFWHLRQDTDPAHRWFREAFYRLFKG